MELIPQATTLLELTNAKRSGGFGSFVGNCPIHGDKSPSLSINLSNEEKPLVFCHAGCDQTELVEYLKENDAWPKKESGANGNYKSISSNNFHDAIWNASKPIVKGDLADKYLTNRGINLDEYPTTLRFNPNCYFQGELNGSDFKGYLSALIGKITDENDSLIGVQRIYLGPEGIKANTDAPKKVSGSFKGGKLILGNPSSSEIHIVEGIETGLAIYKELNETTYCGISATNLSKVPTDKTVKTIHVWADKDTSKTGELEARKAADIFSKRGIKIILHIPNMSIPEGHKSIDFLDMFQKDPMYILDEKCQGEVFNPYQIKVIKERIYDLPTVKDDWLPYIIRDWCISHSERLGTTPEMIMVPFFSVIGSLIGRKIALQPKKNDPWSVHPILWGLIIAPPGSKKSAILKTTLCHLNSIEADEIKKADLIAHQNRFIIKDLELNLKKAKKNYDDSVVNENKNEIPIDLDSLRRKIIECEEKLKGCKPQAIRYSTNSFTPEKLIEILSQNQNGLIIVRDEISGLFNQFEKKGQENTKQFLLEGWNGNGSYTYDLISRETKRIDGIALSVLGGIQPSVIGSITKEIKDNRSNDGFLQRFQLMAYPNISEDNSFIDKGVKEEAESKVNSLFRKIVALDCLRHGTFTTENSPYLVKLDNDSYELFCNYMRQTGKESGSELSDVYKNHIDKVGSLLSGLILIFHIIDNIETGRTNHLVQIHIIQMAIKWCDLFKEHAKKLYDINYNFESIAGFAMAKRIASGNITNGTSIRSIYRNEWAHLKNINEVEAAINFLYKHNWIHKEESKNSTGRPSYTIQFNPGLNDFLKGKWHE